MRMNASGIAHCSSLDRLLEESRRLCFTRKKTPIPMQGIPMIPPIKGKKEKASKRQIIPATTKKSPSKRLAAFSDFETGSCIMASPVNWFVGAGSSLRFNT
jgi:hypothetical protein